MAQHVFLGSGMAVHVSFSGGIFYNYLGVPCLLIGIVGLLYPPLYSHYDFLALGSTNIKTNSSTSDLVFILLLSMFILQRCSQRSGILHYRGTSPKCG